MRKPGYLIALAAASVVCWGADWLTDGYDTKRTAWQPDEKILSAATIKNMKLLWKLKLDNEPRQMHSLFPPLIIGKLNTKSGPREVLIETGVSDNIYAIDVEKGEVIWKKHFESTWTPPANGGRGGG
ncbi:MAG TPA: pyrrolo-quinoline quinone, partial [Verrucomicrobiae bacterium]|nr:pyrrolo-quinoline quinone [Verrucomicrobiae bacterium]